MLGANIVTTCGQHPSPAVGQTLFLEEAFKRRLLSEPICPNQSISHAIYPTRGTPITTQLPDRALVPRLTLRIGITGHRPNKLDPQQQARARRSAAAVLECLSATAMDIHTTHSDVLAPQGPDLRLATSLAEGADTIVAEVAREQGFRLDVILPFPRDTYVEAQGFSAEARATFSGFLTHPAPHSLLELSGDADDPYSASLAYHAAGRRMVAHSDILMTVWNGEREAGVGGTAQIVREAIEQGVPVVWIGLDGRACLVTDLNGLSNFDDNSAILTDTGPCSGDLSDVVRDLLTPAGADDEAGWRLRRFLEEPQRTGSSWSHYDLMRRILTGRRFRWRLDYAVDTATEDAWRRFHERARRIGGADFAAALQDKLETRWRHANNVALHCSHAYRSTYVLNFVLAGLAVLVGLLSVFWWSAADAVLVKAAFVGVEVVLIFVILRLTRRGNRTHQDWHVRWLEARSTAELLRSARLLSLIGDTAAPQDTPEPQDDDAWVEWYVRATLREIGPPTGHLDADSIRTAITSAIEDETDGQIDYNADAAKRYHQIDHTLHVLGERLFRATFYIGLGYVCVALAYKSGIALDLFSAEKHYESFVKAVATVLGAGLPAFGAAAFGIRATGDFKLVSEQAGRTLIALEALKARLETEAAKATPTREQASRLLLALTQALVSDLRDWTKVYRARELQLPG